MVIWMPTELNPECMHTVYGYYDACNAEFGVYAYCVWDFCCLHC